MYYGIKVVKSPDRDVFVVTCRDLPECTYEDPTLEGAVTAAAQCVPGVMELLYRQKRRAIPLPSPLQDGETPVYIPARVQAKILLWNYMVENRYRVADIARMNNITQTQAQRYVDLSKDKASIEAIEEAMSKLGFRLSLTLEKEP